MPLAGFVPNVVVTHPLRPRDNPVLYRLVGGIFASREATERLCRGFEDAVSALESAAGGLAERQVLYLIWRDPWMTVSRDTYVSRTLALGQSPDRRGDNGPRYPRIALTAELLDAVDLVLALERAVSVQGAPRRGGPRPCRRAMPRHSALRRREMASWYGSRAIRAMDYLARFATGLENGTVIARASGCGRPRAACMENIGTNGRLRHDHQRPAGRHGPPDHEEEALNDERRERSAHRAGSRPPDPPTAQRPHARERPGLDPRRGRDALRRQRRRVHRRTRGAVEQHLRERAPGAGGCGGRADERARLRVGVRGQLEPQGESSSRSASHGIAYPDINRFYFTSGGGESTDSNIKMARYYWKLRGKPGKFKVISRELGYHGVTLAAMCATGIPGVLADVRAARAGLLPYPVALSIPVRGAGGG